MTPLVFADVNLNGQQARIRKPHTKSRNGCERCKNKRMKCDEQLPRCGECVKKGAICKRSKTRIDRSSQEQDEISTGFGGQLNMIDLRLLHHFENHTSKSIILFPVRKEIIEQAFENEFLMHTILMISASHMLYQGKDPDRSAQYREAELVHLSLASSGLRAAISSISLENAGSLFSASILIYTQSWCCSSPLDAEDDIRESQNETEAENIDLMVPLGVGIKQMMLEKYTWEFVSKSIPFQSMVEFKPKVVLINHACGAIGEDSFNQYMTKLITAFSNRHGGDKRSPGSKDFAVHLVYTGNETFEGNNSFDVCVQEFGRLGPAYAVLLLVRRGISSLEDDLELEIAVVRYFFTWTVLLSKQFVDLAKKQDPCARAVLFYYYSALREAMEDKDGQVKDLYWWAGNRVKGGLPAMGRRLRKEGVEALDLLNMDICLHQMEELEWT